MYEYTVVRGPERPRRPIFGRRNQTYAEVFAYMLNDFGLDGWEFQRCERGPDGHPLVIFRRPSEPTEAARPAPDMHQPPRPERLDVQPRPARKMLDENREVLDRLRAGRRKVVTPTPDEPREMDNPKASNVADILAEKIARARQSRSPTQS